MKKTLMALTIAATALPAISNADTILGLYAGIGQWQAGLGGDLGNESAPTSIDDILKFKDEGQNVLWAKFEHPIPLIPNVMLKSTSLTSTSSNNYSDTVSLGGSAGLLDLSGDILVDLDLSHIDATLYYEILDNWLTLDVGITARSFSGSYLVNDDGAIIEDSNISGTVPLLYLSAQFDLPLTGFHVGMNTQAISAGDNKIMDTTMLAGYSVGVTPLLDIGFNIGYRDFSFELDEINDTYIDAGFNGAFVEFIAHF